MGRPPFRWELPGSGGAAGRGRVRSAMKCPGFGGYVLNVGQVVGCDDVASGLLSFLSHLGSYAWV